jgi:HlyD family type I secretion membrane fusion protein
MSAATNLAKPARAAATQGAGAIVALLTKGRHEGDPRRQAELRQQVRSVAIVVALALLLLVAWSANAPLAGAVVAPAQVRVEFKRKTIQHQEGGIVREIRVRDGQSVVAGEPLVVVGDVRRESDLGSLREQWLAARVRAARADAEMALAARFDPSDKLHRDGATAAQWAREQQLFAARRHALDEQSTLLRAQIGEAEAQVAALGAQTDALTRSAGFSDEELAINEKLLAQGFVSRARLLGLSRASTDYRSQLNEAKSEQAAARARIAEMRSRLAQLRLTYLTQAADDAKDAAARARELDERLRAAGDQVERQIVRAPVDGTVMALRVAAVGDVVGPRDPLLEIVPARERLVVDARIDPQDVEHVRAGGMAEVRLATADARSAQPLPARITFVSGDRLTQADTGKAWFDVTAEVDAAGLSLPAAQKLGAGVPVELYVTTPDRTLFEYLARPFRAFFNHAMREPG